MSTARRSGGRQGRKSRREVKAEPTGIPVWHGGQYKPLGDSEVLQVLDTAFDILEKIGILTEHKDLIRLAQERGAFIDARDRLCFPRSMAEDMIAKAARRITLHGQSEEHDIELGGDRVHFASNGQNPFVSEYPSGAPRPAELLDVYDFARLGDHCDYVHQFTQTSVATSYGSDTYEQDINVCYALLSGTAKHAGQAVTDAVSMPDVAKIAHAFAGGEQQFRDRPFLSLAQCCVLSPLRFVDDVLDIIQAGVRDAMPVHCIMFSQGGATAPASLAGNLAQTTAEVLASMFMCNIFAGKDDHPVILGNWQGICDLRTGSLTVGGGETGLVNAAGAQIINYLDLPSAVSAGVSDSKMLDAQRGAEVAQNNLLAAMSGANMIAECMGNMSAYLAMSYEGFLCDNDIMGACSRILRGIEVNADSLAFDVIEETITGSNHYLDKDQSLKLMETEYFYPALANRGPYQDWQEKGATDIGQRAHVRVHEILSSHFPRNISEEMDAELRRKFAIDLRKEDMQPGTCRWGKPEVPSR